MRSSWLWLPTCATLLVLLSACDGDDGSTLLVELRTDYVPGVEFAAVQATIADPSMSTERAALLDDDYIGGLRVAELGDVPPGERLLTVRLIDVRGAEIAVRRVRFAVSGNTAVPVIITRSCDTISCPGDETCSGGRCVSQLCLEGVVTAECGAPECTAVTDCGVMSGCSEPRCEGGLCLYAAAADACAAGEYCDVTDGCRRVPGLLDAAMDSGGPPSDGAADSEMDADSGAPSVTLVQSEGGWDTTRVSRRSVSLPTPPTTGNLIVVSVSTSFEVVTSVTDNAGNAYVGAPSNPTSNSPTYCNIFVYYASDIITGPDFTVDVTAESPDRITLAVHELSGADPSAPLAGDILCSGNGAMPSCGPAPGAAAASTNVATLCHNSTRTTAFASPFLIIEAPTESGNDNSALVTAQASASSVEARATLSSDDDWQILLTAFR